MFLFQFMYAGCVSCGFAFEFVFVGELGICLSGFCLVLHLNLDFANPDLSNI